MAYKDQCNTHSDNFRFHYETWILQEVMIWPHFRTEEHILADVKLTWSSANNRMVLNSRRYI